MRSKYSPILLAMLAAGQAYSPMVLAADDEASVETIEVRSVRQKLDQAGRLMDVIQKTEVLDSLMIENKNALSLTDAINNEPGVNVSNECSMCGAKRIMLNGMKGEHTTILIDGLPTHTLISGFYAVDAVATVGIDRIEVARGAGASLIAPEAVGGTVNIISQQAMEPGLSLDVAKGSHDYTALTGNATGVSADGRTGITLSAQYNKQDQEDHDDNLISEAPMQENISFTGFISHDLNESNNLHIRLSKVQSEVFGGPVLGKVKGADSIGQALAGYDGIDSEQLFANDDVNQTYVGKPWEMTEWIKTNREEAYAKWLTEINEQWSAEYAISFANHKQDSFYEGIDYIADDTMVYLRAKFDWLASHHHFVTLGVDSRSEEMRSSTAAMEGTPGYVSDSFDYSTTGFFVQDLWSPSENLEIAFAVRIDKIEADFIDPSKPSVEIDETFIAPRLDMRYFHSDNFTSRFSAGRGYRAPLSFFESDHGILNADKGFLIEVDKLEESLSASYALSYDASEALTATFSVAHSEVDNMAKLEENEDSIPTLSQLDKTASVSTIDFTAGYQPTETLNISVGVEKFFHNDAFKSSYAIAPVEQRATFDLEWQLDQLHLFWSTTWFGARDLTEYGYEGYDLAGDLSSLKPTNSPAHSVSNIRLKYVLSPALEIYAGGQNIFGYTQIEEGDSPLLFDAEGGIDVTYIHGPLHGREFFAGIKVTL